MGVVAELSFLILSFNAYKLVCLFMDNAYENTLSVS